MIPKSALSVLSISFEQKKLALNRTKKFLLSWVNIFRPIGTVTILTADVFRTISTLVSGLSHCIQPMCQTLVAIEEVSWSRIGSQQFK